jgi:hypothetical protein
MKKRKADMRFKNLMIYGLIIITVAIIACSKTKGGSGNDDHHDGGDENDISFPVMRIDKPLADQVFVSGDTVTVDAFITDNGLYRGKIKIVNDANGLVVDEKSVETHFFTSYNFIFKHKTSVTVASNYTVTVEYEDHGNNITTQTRKIKVNP